MTREELHNRTVAPTAWSSFCEGLVAPGRGFAYMCRRPQLWTYAIIPILLNILLSLLAFFLLLAAAGHYAAHLHPHFAGAWYWRALEVVCATGLALLVVALTCAAWLISLVVLCFFFYDRLARQVERLLGLPREAMKDLSLTRQAMEGLADLAVFIVVNIGLLLLNLIPVIGPVAAFAGTLYFNCYIFGVLCLSFPLCVRGIRRRERLVYARRARLYVLGLGLTAFACNLLPLIGPVILAAAVTGAVLLNRKLEAAGV